MKWSDVNKKWVFVIGLVLLVFIGMQFSSEQPTYPDLSTIDLPEKVDFNYHIRPILSQNCYVCHGPDVSTREADLRLDNFEDATAKRKDGGAAIIPGNPNKSLLMQRIVSHDVDFQMPPLEAKKTLSVLEIGLLKRWIEQGAEWKKHWAYVPPQLPITPANIDQEKPSAIIDFLIKKELDLKKISPAVQADKNALIRRVAYLLTGLPPSPAEVNTFISDIKADAYERMVNQYLDSPHFGERWARHWMDLVRYGESSGHEGDFNISSSWQYRDYLIRAFNQDVPYDLFVKEHLAGDMLENPRYNPEEGFNESSLGTAYVFLGEGKHGPVNIKQEEADKIDNVIDVTSKTFQAMTVACARCHDHKFDPIPTTDYYAMYGMMESARLGPIPARRTKLQETQLVQLKALKKEIRTQLGQEWTSTTNQLSFKEAKNFRPQFINQKETTSTASDTSSTFKTIGDFRTGDWGNWRSDGWAFGESPANGEPIIDRNTFQLKEIGNSMASSRVFGTGIQGPLRSPYFIIEHDSIAVRARGKHSDIRIIVENFQLIQGPLHQDMEKIVDEEAWKTYVLDVSLVKGRKAYIEILPGSYEGVRHLYRLQPADYIEVEYALVCDGDIPDLNKPTENPSEIPTINEAIIANWSSGKVTPDQIKALNNWMAKLPQKKISPSIKKLIQEYDAIAVQLQDSTHVIGMTEAEAVFSPVFNRGSVDQMGKEPVTRQFLTAIKGKENALPQEGSGRLAWAEEVVNPSNPISSRVMVNRIWHHLFGRGIVETVDNFGLQGKFPTHPDLLDFLALQFIADGWSIKQLIKHILLTETFQRTTKMVDANQEIDPDNLLLHHFPIRRLESEAIRDGMLAVTGSLDPTLYGASTPVHLNDFMTGRGRPRHSGPLDGAGRRSIYTAVRRNFIPPLMLVFDMPIPFTTFGKRNTTNVPAQSLTLLNDPFVHDQAQKWAIYLLTKKELTIRDKIQDIYMRAFSRNATETEQAQAIAFLENYAKQQGQTLDDLKNDSALWTDYCHTIFNFKEFIHLL